MINNFLLIPILLNLLPFHKMLRMKLLKNEPPGCTKFFFIIFWLNEKEGTTLLINTTGC